MFLREQLSKDATVDNNMFKLKGDSWSLYLERILSPVFYFGVFVLFSESPCVFVCLVLLLW